MGAQDVFRHTKGSIGVALTVLRGHQVEAGILLQALQEALCALIVCRRPGQERNERDLSRPVQGLRQQIRRLDSGCHIVGGKDRDIRRLGVRARVNVHDGDLRL